MTGANVIADLKAVIHTTTPGTVFKAPNFTAMRRQSNDPGLLFGAYHFGQQAATGNFPGLYAGYYLKELPGRDRDTFNGSADDLASFWKSNSASTPPPVT